MDKSNLKSSSAGKDTGVKAGHIVDLLNMIQQCHTDEKKTRALWDQMEFITPSVACKT